MAYEPILLKAYRIAEFSGQVKDKPMYHDCLLLSIEVQKGGYGSNPTGQWTLLRRVEVSVQVTIVVHLYKRRSVVL